MGKGIETDFNATLNNNKRITNNKEKNIVDNNEKDIVRDYLNEIKVVYSSPFSKVRNKMKKNDWFE